MSTPTIPVRPVSVPAVLLGPETAREHIANAIQLLETLPVGSLGARDLQLFDYEALRVRLRCALVWLDNPVSGECEPSSRVAPTGTGPAQVPAEPR